MAIIAPTEDRQVLPTFFRGNTVSDCVLIDKELMIPEAADLTNRERILPHQGFYLIPCFLRKKYLTLLGKN